MVQTEKTAIVLRYANYRENDRMLTLFSPTRGKIEAAARGCRRPKSKLLAASELFALGEFELYEKGGRRTVTGFTLTENFYALRSDWDRLSVGVYLLAVCEAAVQPGQNAQELFMLLLHTLSRLTFTDQPWKPLLTGFLTHFAAIEGVRPRLRHCMTCGRVIAEEEPAWLDLREGGLQCAAHRGPGMPALTPDERRFLAHCLTHGSAEWTEAPGRRAPLGPMRAYVEQRVEQPVRVALPDEASD
ncbi:MAG: DNA repair protein RecO [Clostridia bacterium]|nr:DNA repair protein RecO [Clostridia bacterium]